MGTYCTKSSHLPSHYSDIQACLCTACSKARSRFDVIVKYCHHVYTSCLFRGTKVERKSDYSRRQEDVQLDGQQRLDLFRTALTILRQSQCPMAGTTHNQTTVTCKDACADHKDMRWLAVITRYVRFRVPISIDHNFVIRRFCSQ